MAQGSSEFWKNCMTIAVLSVSMYYFLMNRDHEKEEMFENFLDGLYSIYTKKLLPLEQTYLFHQFHKRKLKETDFTKKTSILLIGQYPTGKSALLNFLLNDDLQITSDISDDKFVIIMQGEKEKIIEGDALLAASGDQFKPLSAFGNDFINSFQGFVMNSKLLRSISIIDTPEIVPGILHLTDRGYNVTGVLDWFAAYADQIILLFDAEKGDICDEFKKIIEVLKIYNDKILIFLHKTETVDYEQLMKIYGALMWSLGSVMHTKQSARVYIGTFYEDHIKNEVYKRLYEDEEDLLHELQSLPRKTDLWKLNELTRRAHLAKVHAYIISTLNSEMPLLYRTKDRKEYLVQNLDIIYKKIEDQYQIPRRYFPELKKMKERLAGQDFAAFVSLKPELLNTVDQMLQYDIPRLLKMVIHDDDNNNS